MVQNVLLGGGSFRVAGKGIPFGTSFLPALVEGRGEPVFPAPALVFGYGLQAESLDMRAEIGVGAALHAPVAAAGAGTLLFGLWLWHG